MTAGRWARIEQVFQTALAVTPEARPGYLERACAGDPDLRREVESMLEADSEAGSFLQAAVHDAVDLMRREAEFTGTKRFTVERCLGAGGFGMVYQVYDRECDAVMALKTLSSTGGRRLYHFKREFRALADISHPNLVTLYELMADEGRWFFTMEYIDGVDFLRFVRPGGRNTAPDTGRLKPALRQLADGVCALHSAGKLHCDLKPHNVLVGVGGHVTILDFGLVRETAWEEGGAAALIGGTPEYMSPEQAAGLPASTASDWYSVGVMLYEALTGTLPFGGATNALLDRKQSQDPPPACAIAPGVPEDLSELSRELLTRDPALRPSSGEVLRRLGLPRDRPAATTAFRPARHFMGRDPELRVLRQAWQAAVHARTTTVYLHGGSGAGKTALARHFIDEIRQAGECLVLAGCCYERESVPYKALDALIDNLNRYLKSLPAAELRSLLPDGLAALTRLFPVLRECEGPAGLAAGHFTVAEPKEARLRGFAALRELLDALARRRPVVLFIDDLQWGDADSAALLIDLLRPPGHLALLFIGAYRSGEAEHGPLLERLLEAHGPRAGGGTVEVAVGALDAETATELAAVLLGGEARASAHAGEIARESGGNPFSIGELVRYSQSRDAVGAAAPSLQNLLRLRVSSLPEPSRRLLEIVCIAGQPVEARVAKAAAELRGEAQTELIRLRLARLVRARKIQNTEHLEAYHDRIREEAEAGLTPPERKQCHHRLAAEWEASGHADPRTLAVHFRAAGINGKAYGYAVAAADQSAAALAFDQAAQFYRMALELAPADGPELQPLRVKLGDSLSNAGRGAEAGEAYLDAAATARKYQELELKRRAAAQFLMAGHIEHGLTVTRGLLAALGMRLPASPWRAILAFLARRMQIRMRAWRFRERDAAAVPAWELLRIDVCMSLVQGLAMVDTIRAHPFHAQGMLLALRSGEPYRICKALCAEAGYLALSGGRHRVKIERLLATADGIAGRIENPHGAGMAALAHGMAAFLQGRWRKAADSMDRAEAVLRQRCTGVAWEIATAHMMGMVALFLMGEWKTLEARLPRILSEAEVRGDLFEATDLRTRLAHALCLAADEPERARREVDAALAQWHRKDFDLQHWWALIGRVEIELYAGDAAAAWARIQAEWRPLRWSLLMRVQYVRIESFHHRARAALALAAAHSAGASQTRALLNAAEEDATRIERCRMGWGYGLAMLLRAGVTAARGETVKSIEHLETAESLLERADMALYAAAARRGRGKILGGDSGRVLVECADAKMRAEGVRNPERVARMLAPGAW